MSDYNFDDDLFGSDDNLDFASEHPFNDDPLPMPEPEDSIEELRNRTSRGDGVDEEFNFDENKTEGSNDSSNSFSISQFSTGQRVILGAFALIDALLIVFGLLLILGIL